MAFARYKIIGIGLIACALLAACHQKKKEAYEEQVMTADVKATEVYVDTLRLKPQTFHRQLICNGKLRAIAKCELSFADGGIVSGVFVQNGSRVSKGQLIARTDAAEAELNVEKAKKELEKLVCCLPTN